jgi:hypothetical protein
VKVLRQAGWTGALIPGEHQKFGADQQQFGGGLLEVSSQHCGT